MLESPARNFSGLVLVPDLSEEKEAEDETELEGDETVAAPERKGADSVRTARMRATRPPTHYRMITRSASLPPTTLHRVRPSPVMILGTSLLRPKVQHAPAVAPRLSTPAPAVRRTSGARQLGIMLLSMVVAALAATGLLALLDRGGPTIEEVPPADASAWDRLRDEAIAYRTRDADPEHRRRIEQELAVALVSDPAEAGSPALTVRAILSSRIERFHRGVNVDDLLKGAKTELAGAVEDLTPVLKARFHENRAMTYLRTGHPEAGLAEIQKALSAVNQEPPFFIDMAEDFLDAGRIEGARAIIESPSWPWSLPAATTIECRMAIASGDLTRAQALLSDLKREGRLDGRTVESFMQKKNALKDTAARKRM